MPYAVGKFYEQVSDYDLEYQSQSEQDVPFWRELLQRLAPKRVLELACGSGRIGLELLQGPGDFLLDGLDLEPSMLKAYRRKLALQPIELQQRVALYEGNMTSYQLPRKGFYDLIFLPFNSICHLFEIEDQIATFKNAYDHLAPGGYFVVDTQLPDLDYLSNALNNPSHVYLEDELEDPNGEFTMHVYTTRRYDPSEQLQRLSWVHEKYFETGENERYLTKLEMHVFFPRELQLLFLSTGFAIDAIYGDYTFKPFGKGTRQIIVGQKPH
uniref:Type 12 methyltransferase n=1 Tax=Thermosporothrix sp. COM3 TaxID=2490863 RepID=A0A455SVI8_9CHLR|nr:type 12 methyltransferase [Thermosporothrix sp. COM3]